MIERNGGARRGLVPGAGVGPGDVARITREAPGVLRAGMDAAHLDACSDAAWPPAVLPSYRSALALARAAVAAGTRSRRADPGMGIDIDARDDAQFRLLLDLAPHTIHAEGRQGRHRVFSADDSGTALWIAVTREQEAELPSRPAVRGIPATALTVHGAAEDRGPVDAGGDGPGAARPHRRRSEPDPPQRSPKARFTVCVTVLPAESCARARSETNRAPFGADSLKRPSCPQAVFRQVRPSS